MSHAEQEMDDCDSLPGVKRQDACVTIEKGDGESFLSMQESSTRIPNEALTLEEQASTNTYSEPLHISAATKPSKVVAKKNMEPHQVYVHIHSKQDKAAFHLDHVM